MSRHYLKSEITKLKHDRATHITLVIFAFMFILYIFAFDGLKLMVSGDINHVGDSIGFYVKEYQKPNSPQFFEIARSSFSFSFFIALLLMFFTLMYLDNEYRMKTYKNFYTKGFSRIKFFSSKISIILIFSIILYNIFVLTIFISSKINVSVSSENMLFFIKILLLMNVVIISFLMLTIAMFVIVKNVLAPAVILLLFNVFIASSYMMNFNNIEYISIIQKVLYASSHMYYWQNLSALRLNQPIILQLLAVHGLIIASSFFAIFKTIKIQDC